MIKKTLLLALVISVPLTAAHAQHPLILQKLNEWNSAAPEPDRQRLETEIRDAAKAVYGDACAKSDVLIDAVHAATAERFVFSSIIAQKLQNAWTVIARQPGCDDVPVRYMVMQNVDNSFRTIRVNRGESYAWDSLISDTVPLVHLAALAALSRQKIVCEKDAGFKLGVTRIASKGESLGNDVFGIRYKGDWSEFWPIETCGRTVKVLIKFTADGDGGASFDIPGEQITIS